MADFYEDKQLTMKQFLVVLAMGYVLNAIPDLMEVRAQSQRVIRSDYVVSSTCLAVQGCPLSIMHDRTLGQDQTFTFPRALMGCVGLVREPLRLA